VLLSSRNSIAGPSSQYPPQTGARFAGARAATTDKFESAGFVYDMLALRGRSRVIKRDGESHEERSDADMLTRIRNAKMARNDRTEIPHSGSRSTWRA